MREPLKRFSHITLPLVGCTNNRIYNFILCVFRISLWLTIYDSLGIEVSFRFKVQQNSFNQDAVTL
jgi:hypothetical protein